jgi:hypothetical protein
MDEVQKPSNPECYTPSSEPFGIYLYSFFKSVFVLFSYLRLDLPSYFFPSDVAANILHAFLIFLLMIYSSLSRSLYWYLVNSQFMKFFILRKQGI